MKMNNWSSINFASIEVHQALFSKATYSFEFIFNLACTTSTFPIHFILTDVHQTPALLIISCSLLVYRGMLWGFFGKHQVYYIFWVRTLFTVSESEKYTWRKGKIRDGNCLEKLWHKKFIKNWDKKFI